jgi:hypothetical protein
VRPEPGRYRHAEAFHLMTYQSDDGSEREQVFNSRDGVTPFVIRLRSGKQATHINWASDERMPEDWSPPPRMRFFADLTAERAREHAERAYDAWAADPAMAADLRRVYGETRELAVAQMAGSYLEQPGAPDLIDPGEPGAEPS